MVMVPVPDLCKPIAPSPRLRLVEQKAELALLSAGVAGAPAIERPADVQGGGGGEGGRQGGDGGAVEEAGGAVVGDGGGGGQRVEDSRLHHEQVVGWASKSQLCGTTAP